MTPQAFSVGWTHKAAAVALHIACLALFAMVVVWPVVAPLARAELARELTSWTSELTGEWLESALPADEPQHGAAGCRPVCLQVHAR